MKTLWVKKIRSKINVGTKNVVEKINNLGPKNFGYKKCWLKNMDLKN